MSDPATPAFSRTTSASPFGKCTEELKTKIPYEVKESFGRLAHELGVTESELLRDMVMTRLFSAEHLVSLYAKRLAGVAGMGQEKTLERGAA